MMKLTNPEKANIVYNIAGQWAGIDNWEMSYESFLSIVACAFALAEEEYRNDAPWCIQTDRMKGLCMGCDHNDFPMGGDTTCCSEFPAEMTDRMLKMWRAKESL